MEIGISSTKSGFQIQTDPEGRQIRILLWKFVPGSYRPSRSDTHLHHMNCNSQSRQCRYWKS